ncbi:MAG: hypothetical protein K5637_02185 [Lachnospiraceae bacterium]|nr:hypothetical protein [Lachnospiraceae bacterium]
MGRFAFEKYYYEEPEKSFSEAFEALKSNNKEEAKKYIDYNAFRSDAGSEEVYEALMTDFEYTLDSIVRDESDRKSATAHVTVSNRDFKKIYGEFVVKAYQKAINNTYAEDPLSDDELKVELDALLLEMLETSDTDPVIAELEFKMNRTERIWHIEVSENDIDLIFGRIMTARRNAEIILGDMSSEALATIETAYKEELNDSVTMIRNSAHFIVDDVWNNCLRHIISCIDAGTDAEGREYDLSEGMAQLDVLRTELIRFHINISSLDGEEYSSIRSAWNSYMNEFESLYTEIVEADPEPEDYDYEPDTAALISAMQLFSDLAYGQPGS